MKSSMNSIVLTQNKKLDKKKLIDTIDVIYIFFNIAVYALLNRFGFYFIARIVIIFLSVSIVLLNFKNFSGSSFLSTNIIVLLVYFLISISLATIQIGDLRILLTTFLNTLLPYSLLLFFKKNHSLNIIELTIVFSMSIVCIIGILDFRLFNLYPSSVLPKYEFILE